MSHVLTISDEVHARFAEAAERFGFASVEEWLSNPDDDRFLAALDYYSRQRNVEEIDELRTRLFAKHGEMPDSISLIAAYRER